jgi:predicted short-subunit dehydrogenase-like oxidoreductase (DUF2520 family)
MNAAFGAASKTSGTVAADDVEGLRVLAPLVRTTTANLLTLGPERALTGPVARGDVSTVRAHLHCSMAAPRLPRPPPYRCRRSPWPRAGSTTTR